ncbi:MAG: zinc ribbon domain-containing protein, partial [Acidobacteria bacterium]|nr:zinc ribbon domain-containing protein [Acidobacteriota bacterium]
MFCDQCGARLEGNQRFCSHCGKELRGVISVAPSHAGRVETHVRMLGILWLALSALDALAGVVAIILANTIFSRWGPSNLPPFLHPLMIGVAIFSIAKAGGGLLTGWGLLNRQGWARGLAVFLGVISLFFHFPFGTALGIYTLWVLLPPDADLA